MQMSIRTTPRVFWKKTFIGALPVPLGSVDEYLLSAPRFVPPLALAYRASLAKKLGESLGLAKRASNTLLVLKLHEYWSSSRSKA